MSGQFGTRVGDALADLVGLAEPPDETLPADWQEDLEAELSKEIRSGLEELDRRLGLAEEQLDELARAVSNAVVDDLQADLDRIEAVIDNEIAVAMRGAIGHVLDRNAAHDANVHIVQHGDHLWGIAQRRLGSAADHFRTTRLWRLIYSENRRTIGPNPNLILPGQRLRVPARLP